MGQTRPPTIVSRSIGDTDCAVIPTLLGHTVALTGDRRHDELAAYLRIRGAEVLHGPFVRIRPVPDDDRRLRQATMAVLADPPDYLLTTTGIGVRGWFNAADSWHVRAELLAALAGARVLARGPKVVGALSEVGLPPWFVAESGRTSSMVDHLMEGALRDVHVALQLPADAMEDTAALLRRAGARVTTIPVYEWGTPEDLDPARRVVRAVAYGRVSAVTFTSRRAVRQFWSMAEAERLQSRVRRALDHQVVPACIGPATGEALHGLSSVRPCLPDRPVLGALGRVVADRLCTVGHHHIGVPDGGDVVVQARLVDGRGTAVLTSGREAAVLGLLLNPTLRTVSRAEIFRAVWPGEAPSLSNLDNTVVRLRRRIEGTGLSIRTVHGRGYLLAGTLRACPAVGGAAPWQHRPFDDARSLERTTA